MLNLLIPVRLAFGEQVTVNNNQNIILLSSKMAHWKIYYKLSRVDREVFVRKEISAYALGI